MIGLENTKYEVKGTSKYNKLFPPLWQELGLTEDASFDDVMTQLLKHRKDKTKKKK